MRRRLRRALHAGLLAAAFIAAAAAATAVTVAIGSARLAPPDRYDCLGAPNAARRAVYLHGLDSFGPSWQELHNRDLLAELAARFDLRLAMPRGVCSRGRCWPEAETAVPWIRAAARACFGDRPHGLIGFSNGGFLVGALARTCAGAEWMLVAGAGADPAGEAAADLSGCPPVRVVVGQGDRHHLEHARSFALDLAGRRARVRLYAFDGGHRLDAEATGRALRDLAGPPGHATGPWHATHAIFAVAGALLVALLYARRRLRDRVRLDGSRRTAHRLLAAAFLGLEAALGVSPGGALATFTGALAAAGLVALAAGAAAALHARDLRPGVIAALGAACAFALSGAAALAVVLWIL